MGLNVAEINPVRTSLDALGGTRLYCNVYRNWLPGGFQIFTIALGGNYLRILDVDCYPRHVHPHVEIPPHVHCSVSRREGTDFMATKENELVQYVALAFIATPGSPLLRAEPWRRVSGNPFSFETGVGENVAR